MPLTDRFPCLTWPHGPVDDYEREVYAWACRYWPGVPLTWRQYRRYYYEQYRRQVARQMAVKAA